MKKSFPLLILLAVSQSLLATPTKDLVSILEKITVYRADFAQKIFDADGKLLSTAQGEMVVSRPNKFYWQAKHPDPILVVADGKTLWNYDKELEQVMRQPLGNALSNSPAKLLAGELSHLEQDFEITEVDRKECSKVSEKCYYLKPTQKDTPVNNIYLGIQKNVVTIVKMHDNLGQNVITHFSNVALNPKVNDKMFQFKPPKGVDVIEAGK